MRSKGVSSSAGQDRRHVALAFVALVAGAIAMGASPIFVRITDVGPFASAFWRTFLALPFLAIWAMVEPRIEHSAKRTSAWGVDRPTLLAGLFFAGDLFFWHLSIFWTTIANATFLATTAPIWVAIGTWLFLREVIAKRILFGLLFGLLGGAALIGQTYGFAPQRLAGDLCGLITAIFFGSYMLSIRAARASMNPGRLALISSAITAACLFVVAYPLEPSMLPHSWNSAWALLGLAFISQAAGQGLLAIALGTLPAPFSSLVIFLEAIAAASFGWIILGEALDGLQLFGGALILFGIWIARPRAVAPGVAL